MPEMLPASRPNITRAQFLAVLNAKGIDLPAKQLVLLGVRGYYRDSMGKPGVNDRGIYDDAAAVGSVKSFDTFNFNTDPSKSVPGIATLKPGVYRYKKGIHGISRPDGGYPAFRPATEDEEVPVTRDGSSRTDLMGSALNIHHGYVNTTGSEGCQTVPPLEWEEFRHLLYAEMERLGLTTFVYVLVTVDEYQAATAAKKVGAA